MTVERPGPANQPAWREVREDDAPASGCLSPRLVRLAEAADERRRHVRGFRHHGEVLIVPQGKPFRADPSGDHRYGAGQGFEDFQPRAAANAQRHREEDAEESAGREPGEDLQAASDLNAASMNLPRSSVDPSHAYT